MATRVTPGPVQCGDNIREAVYVHTNKIYDSCRDKDCLEDLRLYPLGGSQVLIENACSVRARSAELLYVDTNVEEVAFNRGFYAVNATYYYRIRCEVFGAPVPARSAPVIGLAVFNKRVILFGSEGSAKVFSSAENPPELINTGLPTAYVEAVDPIILDIKLADVEPSTVPECELFNAPDAVLAAFEEPIALDNPVRRIYVSLGQFSIVRLERNTQLLVPTYDYTMPEKECVSSESGDPCALFAQVNFPTEEFFPPDTVTTPEGYREALGTMNR